MIDPARDSEGLKAALTELLEESLALSRAEKSLESADAVTRARLLGKLPPRTLAAGYYRAGEHLLWVEERMKVGVALQLSAPEADGLVVLARVRRVFEHNHPPCYRCGAWQDHRFTLACHECGAEFKRDH